MLKNKFLFFILLFIPFYSAYSEMSKPELSFTINSKGTDSNYLTVDLNISNYQSLVDISFGINSKTMDSFSVYDLTGKKLRTNVKDNILKILDVKNSFIIKYRINISEVLANVDEYSKLPNISSNQALILFGYNSFVYPIFSEKLNVNPSIYLKLNFPKLWKTASSFGMNKKDFKVSNIDSLLKSVIVTGNLEIESILIKNKPYHLLFEGDWSDKKERFISVFKTIALQQLKYWDFVPSDFIMVNLIKDKKFSRARGIDYANTLLYFFSKDIDLNNVELLKLIAHEHFHIWNGHYFFSSEKNELLWFKEGLTDYYALLTLVNSELISVESFLSHLLELYTRYNTDIKLTEELKGFFIFFALDMEIRRGSGQKNSLNNFLKNISLRKEFWEFGYTVSDIKSELLKLYYWDLSDFFDKFVVNNNKININNYFNYLGLVLKNQNSYKYQDDLILTTDKQNRTIVKDLSETSQAFLNGLRKKDIIISYDKAKKYPELSSISTNKKNNIIKFSPWKIENKLYFMQNIDNVNFKKWVTGTK